jgi:hypothetical protein
MDSVEKDRASFAWFTQAWDDYTGGLHWLLPVLLAQSAATAGVFWLIDRYHSLAPAAAFMLLVVTPLSTGAVLVYINMARTGRARFRDLFSAFPVYHKALAINIGLGLFTLGGLLAFILPGLVIYLTFCFSEYFLLDRGTGVKESFRRSGELTLGWKTRLFPVFLLTILVTAAPDVALISDPLKNPQVVLDLRPWIITSAVLKTLVFLPWLNLAMARAYNFLLAPPAPVPEPQQAED